MKPYVQHMKEVYERNPEMEAEVEKELEKIINQQHRATTKQNGFLLDYLKEKEIDNNGNH